MLKVGQVGLIRTPFHLLKIRTYLSVLIRFFNKTKYNHVFIITDINGKLFVCETDKIVIATPIEKRLSGKKFIIKELNIVLPSISDHAHEYLGSVGYDYRGTMFDQLIYQLFKVWIGRTKEKADKKMYCSEYVARVINKASGGKLFPDWWKITPKDLIEDIQNFKTIYSN